MAESRPVATFKNDITLINNPEQLFAELAIVVGSAASDEGTHGGPTIGNIFPLSRGRSKMPSTTGRKA